MVSMSSNPCCLRKYNWMRYTRWLTRRQAMEKAEQTAEERRAREDLLRFQYRELTEVGLRPGEDEALESERSRLTSVRRLAEIEHEAYEALYGSDTSILAGLSAVADRVRELGQIDREAAEWTGLADGATAQLRELAQRLRAYGQSLDEDPERLAQVEERLDRLRRLQKKYGGTVETLLSYAEDLKRRLDESADEDTKAAELRTLIDQDRRRLEELAQRLSVDRKTAAVQMETRVEAELRTLRMEHTKFRIAVRPRTGDMLERTGGDDVDYLFSANQGEPLQPLARVASGGELSRTMLAIKTVLAETDAVPVLVFDEVDVGIGGAVATVMGRRLRALSTYHQVFCVTHLPQIASQAHAHFLVHKSVIKKRTVTRVTCLNQDERRDEIARMLGGLTITNATRATAAEMLQEAARDGRS
jgi:DNA repair protein RecN (Recombination protein N)